MSAFQSSLWVTTAISACGSCISHPASLFLFESTFHQVAALLLSPLCLLQASVFLPFRAETPYDCLYSMVKYATFQCQNSDYIKLKFQILAENLDLWFLLLFFNPRIISEPEATVQPLRHQRSNLPKLLASPASWSWSSPPAAPRPGRHGHAAAPRGPRGRGNRRTWAPRRADGEGSFCYPQKYGISLNDIYIICIYIYMYIYNICIYI